MTLLEYLTSEFGIVPDEVQMQKIRLISFMDLDKEFNLNNINTEELPRYDCKVANRKHCYIHDQCQYCTDNK